MINAAKVGMKGLLGWTLTKAGLQRRILTDRGVIVLFHRVDDRLLGDPISVSCHEFRAYCAYFKRQFEVVPLSEMVGRIGAGKKVDGLLSITFDDGYLDNFTNAAPILKQLGLPACFFLATGFIGSRTVPWWDQMLGFEPGWMTWDNVRSMLRDGFEFGAHTVTHVDLGVVDGATADKEISGSCAALRAETGIERPMFAYPYGGRQNITESNRALIQSAGAGGCVSAYGGFVHPGDDPFRLMRINTMPISLTVEEFGYTVARFRTQDRWRQATAAA